MPKSLKAPFLSTSLRARSSSLMLKQQLLLLFGIVSAYLISSYGVISKGWIAYSVIPIVLVPLSVALLSLMLRLRDVVKFGKAATGSDLLLSLTLYGYTMVAFGFLYFFSQSFLGEDIFKNSVGPTHIVLTDAIYFSGATIATVGYGDFTPQHWLIKFGAIGEAALGLGLIAIVVGFFIGSLLGRQQQEKETRWFREFVTQYVETVTKYRDAIMSGEDLNKETIIHLRQDLLRTVASLVGRYTMSSAQITVNWMQIYNRSKALPQLVDLAKQFVPAHLQDAAVEGTFGGILAIREWGEKPEEMPDQGEFALPVYDPGSPLQLPGGPLAAISDDGYHVIPDTRRIDLSNQDNVVKQRLIKYFQDHSQELKSFASIKMELANEVLGVLNVQSNQTELCGFSDDEERLIVEMIKPFAQHIAEMIYLEAIISSDEDAHEDEDKQREGSRPQ